MLFHSIAAAETQGPLGSMRVPAASPISTGNGQSGSPSISPDGRFILFSSQALDLVTNQPPSRFIQTFMRDLTNGVIRLASASSNGVAPANGHSLNGAFLKGIGLGQFVPVFESNAADISPSDSDSGTDVFVAGSLVQPTGALVYRPGETILKAVAADGSAAVIANAAAIKGAIQPTNFLFLLEPDGTTTPITNSVASLAENQFVAVANMGASVAFLSTKSGLVPGDADSTNDLFLWLKTDRSFLRINTPGHLPLSATMTPDGKFVAYVISAATTQRQVWWRDLTEPTNRLVAEFSTTADAPGQRELFLSADGQRVLFHGGYRDIGATDAVALPPFDFQAFSADGRRAAAVLLTNSFDGELWIFDLQTGTSNAITRTVGPANTPATGISGVTMSTNGLLVAFQSTDPLLVQGDLNRAPDVFVASTLTGEVQLVSRRLPTAPSVLQFDDARFSSVLSSADGKWTGFMTTSPLDVEDTNGMADVYLIDNVGNTLVWATAGTNGVRAGSGAVVQAALSENGRVLVFSSLASNLTSVVDSNLLEDVFLFDTQTRTLKLLSLSTNGITTGNGSSLKPSVSADGSIVVFQTTASDILVDGLQGSKIVAFRENASALARISGSYVIPQSFGGTLAISNAANPTISGDGAAIGFYVGMSPTDFSSGAYAAGRTNRATNVLFSFATQGGTQSRPSFDAVFGKDGSRLLVSPLPNAFITSNIVFAMDLGAGTKIGVTNLLRPLSFSPTLEPNANVSGGLALIERSGINAGSIFSNAVAVVVNLTNGVAEPISIPKLRTHVGPIRSSISPDGRWVAFATHSPDAVPGDTNQVMDVFLHDRLSRTTTALSVDPLTGNLPVSGSSQPVFLRDGRTLIFQNVAIDLALATNGPGTSVLVFNPALITVDSDNDGLDDAWELARFGTLSRDGAGDFDGDGSSDLAEFLAGSDPKNAASKFAPRFAANPGGVRLEWPARPGLGYRVEFKDDLGAASWQPLPSSVASVGSIASCTDTNSAAATNRFYRIVAVP